MARFYSDFLAAYADAQVVSEAPAVAHLWSGVWAVAGALRRNVWFDGGGFSWTPNMYTVLVGPPGVIQKSTTAGKAARVLAQVPGVEFGPASATWHGLIPRFNAAEHPVVIDGTTYKVSPLTMAVSELGSFLKLSQEGLDAVLIDMWDAKLDLHPWTHSTQTHGDKSVWNGCLNLLGCTTLGWLRQNVPADALETGLVSRILFVYADQKREKISIPRLDPRWDPKAQRETNRHLIADLQEIAKLRGPLEFTPGAYAWQREWYESLDQRRGEFLASERSVVYRSRKQTHVMKLAIVLSCARGDSLQIDEATIREAAEVVEATERGMFRVFESIGGPQEAQHVREVVTLVRALYLATPEPVSVADLYRRLQNVLAYDELGGAIKVAVENGILRAEKAARGAPGLVPVAEGAA